MAEAMKVLTEASAGVGIPFRLRDIVQAVDSLWTHLQYISENFKKTPKLTENVGKLQRLLKSLNAEPDDITSQLILDNLAYVDALVQSVKPRGVRAYFMATKYHEKLQKADAKLEHLITQCTLLQTRDKLDHLITQYTILQTRDRSTCDLELGPFQSTFGLDRSARVMTFLEKSHASNQPLRVIVIHGQPGIGKSTLLRKVWKAASSEPPFLARSYVQLGEDLRPTDITKLQSDICQDLGGGKVDFRAQDFGQSGLSKLFQRLKGESNPVFLAIDNVFDPDHLTSVLPSNLAIEDMPISSCIVVTCRDRTIGNDILRICHLEEDNSSQVLFFEPPYLSPNVSKELFAECARIDVSDPAHQPLLDALVPLCQGLPLALRVLGSMFTNEKQRELKNWHSIREQWTTFDDSDDRHTSMVTKTIHLSYKLLPDTRKQAFLDVVSTFYGWPWKMVECIVGEKVLTDLHDSSLISKVESRDLCSQSALNLRWCDVEKEELFEQSRFEWGGRCHGFVWVHDLTLRFGESLNKNEVNRLGCSGDCQQHGYVEHPLTDICDLPNVTDLRNIVLRISYAAANELIFALPSYLQRATKLQTLIVQRAQQALPSTIKYRLAGRVDHCKLRFFSYSGQWEEGWNEFLKVSREIRCIDLHHSDLVQLSPNFPGLEMLNVSYCKELQEFGEMPSKSLCLRGCTSLTKLPEFVGGELEGSLRELAVDCQSLVEIPASIGKLRSVKSVYLASSILTKLPESVGSMEVLEHLSVYDCDSLKELPASLGMLRSVKTLWLKRCPKLTKLPESLGSMESLEHLSVLICDNLEELPDSLGMLRAVKYLRLAWCPKLMKLPESVGSMESLEQLSVRECKCLEELPAKLGMLRSVKGLRIERCHKLTKLPESVGSMESLEHLLVEDCAGLEELPASLGMLRSVKELNLVGCPKLTKLPESVTSMESLEQLSVRGCESLEELPASLGMLRSVKYLSLSWCPKLTKLPESVGSIESLEQLTVFGCESLEEVPAMLRFVNRLTIDKCPKLRKLPESVGSMESSGQLFLDRFYSLEELPASLGMLRSVKTLRLYECNKLRKLPESVGDMESLEQLLLKGCDSLEELPASLGMLRSVKELKIERCPKLTKLPESVGSMESLERLAVDDCDNLEELPDSLGMLRSVKSLSLCCPKLMKFPESVGSMESLEQLWLSNCGSLEELPASLGMLRSVKMLCLGSCPKLRKLPESVGSMESLEQLWLCNCGSLEELPASLGMLRSVKKLELLQCPKLRKLPESVRCMKSISWKSCEGLGDDRASSE